MIVRVLVVPALKLNLICRQTGNFGLTIIAFACPRMVAMMITVTISMIVAMIMLNSAVSFSGFINERTCQSGVENVVRLAATLLTNIQRGAGVDERRQGQK